MLLDGKPVNSCQVLAGSVDGADVKTVKGIDAEWIVQALADAGGVQCGFCTPGFVISIYYLLKTMPDADEESIKKALDGNLCRCTGYVKILEGVRIAMERMKKNV